MSSIVCQNFQSGLESRALGIQVAASNLPLFLCDMRSPQMSELDSNIEEPQKYGDIVINTTTTNTNNNNNEEEEDDNKNNVSTDFGSWSSIESLTKNVDEKNKEESYVHPLVKRSSSTLSEKSLELCTENLGSETGTDVSDDDINFSPSMSNSNDNWRSSSSSSPPRKRPNFLQFSMHEKVINRQRSFPPPLTTISNYDNCVQIRPHREGGRLVIKAIAIEASTTYFQAERSNGRLRLVLKEQFEEKEEQEQEQEQDEEEQEEQEIEVEEEDEEEEEEEEEERSANGNFCEVNIGANRLGENEAELGSMGNFNRPSRCMEHGKKEFSNWEHFCVAT